MTLALALMHLVHRGIGLGIRKGSKTHKFVMGQKGLLAHIADNMQGDDRPVCWVHAASLGEFGVARPVIARLRQQGYSVVLTFFSSSGYEAVKPRTDVADHVFYLPLDTRKNVRRFLDLVRPRRAVFIISEYWMNYLNELRARQIPTFLVSALVPDTSYLLKWYARPIRKALRAITTFMVLDQRSKDNLARMGFQNCKVTGDPLFDNALLTARSHYDNAVVERFCAGQRAVFVAGSVNDDHDVQIVTGLANRMPGLKCLVVPHEVTPEALRQIESCCQGRVVRYSACTADTDLTQAQVLVIDYVGDLARLYRYGTHAYVGGGFTPYLHSVIEPVVYGLPVAFGPNIRRKVTPRQMMDLGVGAIVTSAEELCAWYGKVSGEAYGALSQRAKDYALSNGGATDTIIDEILR